MLIAGAEERFLLRVARVNEKNEILTNFQKLNKSQILGGHIPPNHLLVEPR